ncbi:MAG: hypothetical protein D6719_00050 [Candidatus Dadabacteria bacterium]|nr:MAG: hypothetical protein D6719_00050 [Candidatus Dadabacteria bacterium]
MANNPVIKDNQKREQVQQSGTEHRRSSETARAANSRTEHHETFSQRERAHDRREATEINFSTQVVQRDTLTNKAARTTSSGNSAARSNEQAHQAREAAQDLEHGSKTRKRRKRSRASVTFATRTVQVSAEVLEQIEDLLERKGEGRSGYDISGPELQNIAKELLTDLKGSNLLSISQGDLSEIGAIKDAVKELIKENFYGSGKEELIEALGDEIAANLVYQAVEQALSKDIVDKQLLFEALRAADLKTISRIEELYQAEHGHALLMELNNLLDDTEEQALQELLRDQDARFDALSISEALNKKPPDADAVIRLYMNRSTEEIKAFEQAFNEINRDLVGINAALKLNLSENQYALIEALRSADKSSLDVIRWYQELQNGEQSSRAFVEYYESLSQEERKSFADRYFQLFQHADKSILDFVSETEREYLLALRDNNQQKIALYGLRLSVDYGESVTDAWMILHGKDPEEISKILDEYKRTFGTGFIEQARAIYGPGAEGQKVKDLLETLTQTGGLTQEQVSVLLTHAVREYAVKKGTLLGSEETRERELKILETNFARFQESMADLYEAVPDLRVQVEKAIETQTAQIRSGAIIATVDKLGREIGIETELAERGDAQAAYRLEVLKRNFAAFLDRNESFISGSQGFMDQLDARMEQAVENGRLSAVRARGLAVEMHTKLFSAISDRDGFIRKLESLSPEDRELIMRAYQAEYHEKVTENEKYEKKLKGFEREHFENLISNNEVRLLSDMLYRAVKDKADVATLQQIFAYYPDELLEQAVADFNQRFAPNITEVVTTGYGEWTASEVKYFENFDDVLKYKLGREGYREFQATRLHGPLYAEVVAFDRALKDKDMDGIKRGLMQFGHQQEFRELLAARRGIDLETLEAQLTSSNPGLDSEAIHRKALSEALNGMLREKLKGEDLAMVLALAEGDRVGAFVHELLGTRKRFWRDDNNRAKELILSLRDGVDAQGNLLDRSAIRQAVMERFQKEAPGGVSLTEWIEDHFKGAERQVLVSVVENGAVEDAYLLIAAQQGFGKTDVDLIKEVLADKTRTEILEIEKRYVELKREENPFYTGSLEGDLKKELSGDDDFQVVSLLLRGRLDLENPDLPPGVTLAEEIMTRAELLRHHTESGFFQGVDHLFYTDDGKERGFVQTARTNFMGAPVWLGAKGLHMLLGGAGSRDKANEDYEKLKEYYEKMDQNDPAQVAELFRLAQSSSGSLNAYGGYLSTVTSETAGVVRTAAVVGVVTATTIASYGAASGLWAGAGGLWAAGGATAIAGLGSDLFIKKGLIGDAYGGEEIWVDTGLAALDGATIVPGALIGRYASHGIARGLVRIGISARAGGALAGEALEAEVALTMRSLQQSSRLYRIGTSVVDGVFDGFASGAIMEGTRASIYYDWKQYGVLSGVEEVFKASLEGGKYGAMFGAAFGGTFAVAGELPGMARSAGRSVKDGAKRVFRGSKNSTQPELKLVEPLAASEAAAGSPSNESVVTLERNAPGRETRPSRVTAETHAATAEQGNITSIESLQEKYGARPDGTKNPGGRLAETIEFPGTTRSSAALQHAPSTVPEPVVELKLRPAEARDPGMHYVDMVAGDSAIPAGDRAAELERFVLNQKSSLAQAANKGDRNAIINRIKHAEERIADLTGIQPSAASESVETSGRHVSESGGEASEKVPSSGSDRQAVDDFLADLFSESNSAGGSDVASGAGRSAPTDGRPVTRGSAQNSPDGSGLAGRSGGTAQSSPPSGNRRTVESFLNSLYPESNPSGFKAMHTSEEAGGGARIETPGNDAVDTPNRGSAEPELQPAPETQPETATAVMDVPAEKDIFDIDQLIDDVNREFGTEIKLSNEPQSPKEMVDSFIKELEAEQKSARDAVEELISTTAADRQAVEDLIRSTSKPEAGASTENRVSNPQRTEPQRRVEPEPFKEVENEFEVDGNTVRIVEPEEVPDNIPSEMPEKTELEVVEPEPKVKPEGETAGKPFHDAYAKPHPDPQPHPDPMGEPKPYPQPEALALEQLKETYEPTRSKLKLKAREGSGGAGQKSENKNKGWRLVREYYKKKRQHENVIRPEELVGRNRLKHVKFAHHYNDEFSPEYISLLVREEVF